MPMIENTETPAREIFPEYETMLRLFADEVRGLTDEVLDRRRPDKGWGGWSIREQVSHVAWIPFLIFHIYWGEILFGKSPPKDAVRAYTGGADRMLDPARYRDMGDILGVLDEGFAEAWDILGRETLGSMREKILLRKIDPARTWANGERVIDYFESLVVPAHKTGLCRDSDDPHLFHQTLESTMRHVLWEGWVHLKTIQLHKAAEGLPTGPPVPDEGYVSLAAWD